MKQSDEAESVTARPIFIVGSPRSGTSVLAWCLGQHPNILPVPESDWMGDFAVSVAISHQIGAARENRSLLSAMDISRDEFFASFGENINELILAHREDLQRKRNCEGLRITAYSSSGPKRRWVDGTPEYSLHICGLRKLFPGALFVHLVRDVDSVVRSLLNFHRIAGTRLVASEEEAYKYWLRRVNASLQAEKAYGPDVIHRLRYSMLVSDPESAIRSLLEFVGEPYSANCLEPLAQRINSSNVPADFKSDDPATDPNIVLQARRLSAAIEESAQPSSASPAAADEMEGLFEETCLKTRTREKEIARQRQHYLAEIEGYKAQISDQQQHYLSEIERHKSQILDQQQHYIAEIQEYKSSIVKEQQHYLGEVEQYKVQLASQEQHYANREQHHINQEQHYKHRLRKQLDEIEKLAGWLDQAANIVASLHSSALWRVANKLAILEAKLFRHKSSAPDPRFKSILTRYARWRSSHPDSGKLDCSTDPTGSPAHSSNSDAKVETASDIQSIENARGTSAQA